MALKLYKNKAAKLEAEINHQDKITLFRASKVKNTTSYVCT